MAGVAGRTWAWLRSWRGGPSAPPTEVTVERAGVLSRWSSWVWSWRSDPVEEFWEAQEKLPPEKVAAVGASKGGAEEERPASRWWSRLLLTPHLWSRPGETRGDGGDVNGDFSDYGTPPPSPPAARPALPSPFRLFSDSWAVEIAPEHYEICFNFLRHLFDLCVVAFLWVVSPPTRLVLEVLGVQGSLRLWFHGMAMFLVSTVGMGGLLWLIQEYLAQFALVYGIVQALVISVSVRQSVILGVGGENDGADEMKKIEDAGESGRQMDEGSSLTEI